jgi:hypothetical protein
MQVGMNERKHHLRDDLGDDGMGAAGAVPLSAEEVDDLQAREGDPDREMSQEARAEAEMAEAAAEERARRDGAS